MPDVLIEEKRKYGIDCRNAVWASDEMHDLYHACGLPQILSDADFSIETEDYILLVEYKNANIEEALAHQNENNPYNPCEEKRMDKIVHKFYDSLHYLHLMGKTKPIKYVFVLEYPKGNSSSRKGLRNKLKKKLPFKLQEMVHAEQDLIASFDVMNIAEWNADGYFGRFPIKPVAELGT